MAHATDLNVAPCEDYFDAACNILNPLGPCDDYHVAASEATAPRCQCSETEPLVHRATLTGGGTSLDPACSSLVSSSSGELLSEASSRRPDANSARASPAPEVRQSDRSGAAGHGRSPTTETTAVEADDTADAADGVLPLLIPLVWTLILERAIGRNGISKAHRACPETRPAHTALIVTRRQTLPARVEVQHSQQSSVQIGDDELSHAQPRGSKRKADDSRSHSLPHAAFKSSKRPRLGDAPRNSGTGVKRVRKNGVVRRKTPQVAKQVLSLDPILKSKTNSTTKHNARGACINLCTGHSDI